MACLTAEQLESLARGADADELREHVEHCADCLRRLEECRANEKALDEIRDLSDSIWHMLADQTPSVSAERAPPARAGPTPVPDYFPGYRVIREIHHGGQGVVYEAVQAGTEMTVALKVLPGGRHADERSRWRFEQEVRLIASLRHPGIVAIHDSGIAEGQYFFAMEYVCGRPLDTHVRMTRAGVRDVVDLIRQTCDALAYAHQRQVIHRDLKPGNILVDEDGRPRILDFGLAKIVTPDFASGLGRAVSLAGQIMGTLPYMAPEQTTGDPNAADTRTDVFALGVILYELLTGTLPYKTLGLDLAEAIRNIREERPVRPSQLRRELNSEIDAIILKAMEKEADRRYGSAAELRDDLAAWLDGRPISAKSASSLYVLRKLAVRHRYATGVVALLMAAIAGFAGISLHYYLEAAEALERERSARAAAEAVIRNLLDLSDEVRRGLDRSGVVLPTTRPATQTGGGP